MLIVSKLSNKLNISNLNNNSIKQLYEISRYTMNKHLNLQVFIKECLVILMKCQVE